MEGNSIINTTPAGKVDAQKWLRFSEVLTLSLGAGLLLSGIIFFFAYNWETIHRFVKMGIVAALLLSTFVSVVKVPMRDWVRNITIFSMCILVGAFLALFGQIYQTGADSYTLFLSWAICIVVWVVVADFYPLWIFFIGLTMLGVHNTHNIAITIEHRTATITWLNRRRNLICYNIALITRFRTNNAIGNFQFLA